LNRLVYGRELQAADYTDPNGQLGTLTGTLVLQRTLPVFAYQYPEFSAMLSDFSDAPGMYKQTEMTRIVIQAAVQLYNASLTGGRPIGWQTATEGQTTDVPFTLTDYISVPVAIGQNILGATTRKLFDEQAVLAIKAIAGYLATMVTNLFTGGPGGTFNYYSTVSGTVVPNAYPTYQVTSQEFSTKDLDKIGAAFTSAKVPPDERFILLNPTFYALLRNDLRLWFMYAASSRDTGNGASNFLTEAKLPKLSGFGIYEAGYMPSSVTNATLGVTTSNIVGVALHKAGVIVKSRLPQDFASSVTAMVPGSITTVSDPDTKTALMLVQYINLTQNFAEWRPEVMLGVAGGDIRGGLVIAGS
jgi:hypothetical protein